MSPALIASASARRVMVEFCGAFSASSASSAADRLWLPLSAAALAST